MLMGSSANQPFILVVDDNRDAANLMAELLQLCGHNCAAAYDGPAGIQAAKNFGPDIILLDLLMPGMDGFEVARALRSDTQTSSIKLIAFSALSNAAAIHAAKEAGFDFHLPKPASIMQVTRVIADARFPRGQATPPMHTARNNATGVMQTSQDFGYRSGFSLDSDHGTQ